MDGAIAEEDDFELQRKFIKDNAYDFDYHDTDKFSEAFRNKYPKIFNNSLISPFSEHR